MPTPSGFAEVSIQLTHSTLPRSAYLVFGVDPTATDPVQVSQAVITSLTGAASLQGALDSQVTFANVRTALGTDGGEDAIGVVNAGLLGLSSGSTPPANVAILVRKNTIRGGRRGRGRMYLPWSVATTSVDEAGGVLTAAVSALQSKMNSFFSALNANQVPMVLLHNEGVSTPGAPNVVTSLVVDSRVATQRRRLGRT